MYTRSPLFNFRKEYRVLDPYDELFAYPPVYKLLFLLSWKCTEEDLLAKIKQDITYTPFLGAVNTPALRS
jgi:hypothetical protein